MEALAPDRRGARRHPRPRGARRPVRLAPAHPGPARPVREGRVAVPRLHDGLGRHRQRLRPLADRGLPPPRCVGGAARTGRRPVEHVLRAGTAGRSGRARPALRRRSSGWRPATGAPTSASTSASTAPACSARRAWTTGSRSCRGSGTCTASSSASTRTAKSPRCRCATSSSLLVENGYTGAISSEYEGWHWNYWETPFDIIRAEQAVQRSAAADAGSRMITDLAEARAQLDAPGCPRLTEGAGA